MFLMSIYSGEYARYRCWYTTTWNSYSQSYQHTAYLYGGIPLPRHARDMTSTGNMIMLIIMQYMQYKLCQHTTYFYYVIMRQNISMSTFNIIILTCTIIMSTCEVLPNYSDMQDNYISCSHVNYITKKKQLLAY